MRKFTAFLLVMLLCVSVLGVAASAATTPAISVTSATAARGDQVTVTASIDSNPGVAYIAAQLSYDHDCLELVSMSGSVDGNAMTCVLATGKAGWVGSGDSTYTGQFLTATFKVKDGAALGNTAVTVTMVEAYNWNEDDVIFAAARGNVTVTVPSHEHTYGEWTQTVAPGCTTKGEEARTCTVTDCGTTEKRDVAALGHSFGEWTQTVAPGCTTKGEETRTCTATGCGETEKRDVATLSHTFGEWKQTKAPTCTEKGEETRTCTATGCGETEKRDVAALGHTTGEWEKDAENHWHNCSVCTDKVDTAAHTFDWIVDKKATAKEDGLQHQECSICGYAKAGVKIPATGEDLDDVPQTSDITPVITLAAVAVIAVFAATAFAFKRKSVK